MIEWCKVLSYSLTNGIRVFMCLLMVVQLLKSSKVGRSALWLSWLLGLLTAILLPISNLGIKAMEVFAILIILYIRFHCKLRICTFLTLFYEIAVELWDFLFSTGIAIILHNEAFMDNTTFEYVVAVWLVRLLMICIAIFIIKQNDKAAKAFNRLISIISVIGMFCILVLTEQSLILLPDAQLIKWVILSVILLMSVLFYKLNHQYEMERELARLKTEQIELIESEYRRLNRVYSVNAKLYHDFHNHLDALYFYISHGQSESALCYIKDLRTPVEKITRCIWTGDDAVDYMISSKIAVAEHSGIRTKVSIDFPRHTNIKSTDLTAILGNLLDNALDAMVEPSISPYFLYLTIRRINDMLIIKVENSCVEKVMIGDADIKTTKADTELHGWGLKSVRAAAERYDGTLDISCENGVFCTVVMLSFEAI